MTELRVDAERRTARVGAGVLWGDVVERAGRVDLAARHTSQPRRRRRRLVAGWRPELVLPPARPAVQRDHRGRARAGRRHRSSGRPTTSTATCCGRPVAVAAASVSSPRSSSTCCRCARCTPGCWLWDWTSAERVLTTWGAVGGDGPGVRHQRRPAAAGPRRAVAAGRGQGAAARDHRRRRAGRARRGRARCSPRCGRCEPEIDTFDEVPAASIAHLQLDPVAPTAVYANSVLLDELPERAVEALVAAAGHGSGSELLFVELRQLGGALSRARLRAAARWTGWTAPCWCSASGSTRAPDGRPCARTPTGSLGLAPALGHRLGVPPDGRRRRGRAPRLAGRARGSASSAIRGSADPHGLFVSPPPRPADDADQSGSRRRQVRLKASGSTVVLQSPPRPPGGTP